MTDGRRSATRVVIAALAVIALVVAGGVVWSWRWVAPLMRWLNTFVTSPGFGALAAVVAAVIAYTAANRRLTVDREVERQRQSEARTEAERQRWQELLMWVAENIETAPPDQMVRVCEELGLQAHTDGQKGMLAAIVTSRLDQDNAEVPDDDT